jgi:tritrans,polycis-undecaprenyl-diphosphate synthase [geranylgeranyl-diphosphate specific]
MVPNKEWKKSRTHWSDSGWKQALGRRTFASNMAWPQGRRGQNRRLDRLVLRLPQRQINHALFVLNLAEEKLTKILTDARIHRNKVHVRIIGRQELLPKSIQDLSVKVEEATKDYDEHFLNIALAYGGRAEIIDVARKLAREVEKGSLKPDAIEEELFEKYLYTAHLPKQDPDMIIRTSGEERLSGFLLWQSAYSELFFLDIYWPDFRRIDLLRAVRTFQRRRRRFGQ